jgi:hypothetical protein
VPSIAAKDIIQEVCRITLPKIGKITCGPLHTIVRDSEGNYYYSDELNHSVVSLDEKGSLRWFRNKKGSDPGEFYYPRGLSLGWILENGHDHNVLAVADAWNQRIQLLDLDGKVIKEWIQSEEKRFQEIVDIRFIGGKTNGRWFALDKNNHRLFAIDKEGKNIFEMGSCFPPKMENRWAIPNAIHTIEDIACMPQSTVYDFLYYPERILGNSEKNLYLKEPFSRRIKQVKRPFIFPISTQMYETVDWITADNFGLIGWNQSASRILRCNCAGDLIIQTEIKGKPIACNLSTEEFWMQEDACILRWKWNANIIYQKGDGTSAYELLLRSAQNEMKHFDDNRIHIAYEAWILVRTEIRLFANHLLSLRGKEIKQDIQSHLTACTNILHDKRIRIEREMNESLHHWCLATLIVHQIQKEGEISGWYAERMRNIRDSFSSMVYAETKEIESCIKELEEKWNESENNASWSDDSAKMWRQISKIVNEDLKKISGSCG